MQSNEPKQFNDDSRVGVAALIGGMVLLVAVLLGLVAHAVSNSGAPTPAKPTPTHGPCATCIATPLPTRLLPTEVPTVEGTAVPPIDTEVPPVATEVPTIEPPVSTEPPPLPTDLPTAQPTAPEPVPTQ